MKRFLILLGILLLINGISFCAVPNEIRYNGKIKEYKEAVTGTRNINFRIYPTKTGGTAVWEQTYNSVQISSGIFSVTLAPETVDWRNKDYYIEMEVGGKKLSPREKITAVPYSIHSATSESGNVTATGEYSVTVGTEKKLIVNSDGVKEVKGTTEYYMVPKGGIIIWSGSVTDIPAGWVLCDGTNGTPDLRGRFVLGYDGTAYNVGDTGGEATHTLTITEMPSHNHVYYTGKGENTVRSGYPANAETGTIYQTLTTNSAGGGQPHNNMPPYYVLCYIMKQ
ncbi:MAG: hypothetical protein II816_03320 [Elusimicrobia bacterium]|nr:hypothetical protein [Elusimicrobiota bacterium]